MPFDEYQDCAIARRLASTTAAFYRRHDKPGHRLAVRSPLEDAAAALLEGIAGTLLKTFQLR